MNERIRELRERAFDWVQNQLHTLGSDHQVTQDQQLQMVNEKFAQLIVRECADLMNSDKDSDRHVMWNRALYETRGKILRHFGVEE